MGDRAVAHRRAVRLVRWRGLRSAVVELARRLAAWWCGGAMASGAGCGATQRKARGGDGARARRGGTVAVAPRRGAVARWRIGGERVFVCRPCARRGPLGMWWWVVTGSGWPAGSLGAAVGGRWGE
ncbi:hypothetical protein Asi02nite_26470 [Asanoa siamensis]|uniref:Uncharacterized protein n=1 Tax=Asanoa siamensis TaxID=926357 RepID=A0ABQ4CPC7_9ACTN|nr:hypothetical protein Asi02nite_26470 [Asanoa siamensis]